MASSPRRYHTRNSLFTLVLLLLYKNDPRLPALKKQVDGLDNLLKVAFDKITTVRGAHVHETRYNDEDLDRLNLLELLLEQAEGGDIAQLLFPSAIRKTRKKWETTIVSNNEEINGLLDIYFTVLHQIIFDGQGNWISPLPVRHSG